MIRFGIVVVIGLVSIVVPTVNADWTWVRKWLVKPERSVEIRKLVRAEAMQVEDGTVFFLGNAKVAHNIDRVDGEEGLVHLTAKLGWKLHKGKGIVEVRDLEYSTYELLVVFLLTSLAANCFLSFSNRLLLYSSAFA